MKKLLWMMAATPVLAYEPADWENRMSLQDRWQAHQKGTLNRSASAQAISKRADAQAREAGHDNETKARVYDAMVAELIGARKVAAAKAYARLIKHEAIPPLYVLHQGKVQSSCCSVRHVPEGYALATEEDFTTGTLLYVKAPQGGMRMFLQPERGVDWPPNLPTPLQLRAMLQLEVADNPWELPTNEEMLAAIERQRGSRPFGFDGVLFGLNKGTLYCFDTMEPVKRITLKNIYEHIDECREIAFGGQDVSLPPADTLSDADMSNRIIRRLGGYLPPDWGGFYVLGNCAIMCREKPLERRFLEPLYSSMSQYPIRYGDPRLWDNPAMQATKQS